MFPLLFDVFCKEKYTAIYIYYCKLKKKVTYNIITIFYSI